jgi:hypothetical protein
MTGLREHDNKPTGSLKQQNSLIFTVVPSVAVEWLALLLCIWEVPGSNLGPETGYPQAFLVFLSPRKMPG